MAASETPTRLYDLMHERAISKDNGLPDQAVLDEVESALSGVCEFLVDPIADTVTGLMVEGKANSMTYEDIGRLITWADGIRDRAMDIVESAAKVHVAAREAGSIAAGYDDPRSDLFSKIGLVVDRQSFEYVARRFADVAREA